MKINDIAFLILLLTPSEAIAQAPIVNGHLLLPAISIQPTALRDVEIMANGKVAEQFRLPRIALIGKGNVMDQEEPVVVVQRRKAKDIDIQAIIARANQIANSEAAVKAVILNEKSGKAVGMLPLIDHLDQDLEKVTLKAGNYATLSPKFFPGHKFEFIRVLGKGGYGEAYLLKDRQSQSLLVLKKDNRIATKDILEKAVIEYDILSDPSVRLSVDGFKPFIFGSTVYTPMMFIQGQSWLSMIINRLLSPTQIQEIREKVWVSLGSLHRAGIVHNDAAARNVIITPNLEPILIDYGLARRVKKNRLQKAAFQEDNAIFLLNFIYLRQSGLLSP